MSIGMRTINSSVLFILGVSITYLSILQIALHHFEQTITPDEYVVAISIKLTMFPVCNADGATRVDEDASAV